MQSWLRVCCVGLPTLALVGTTFAQGVQQELGLSAAVPRFCTIAGAATPGALNATIPVNSFGKVTTTQQTFTVANVVCNTTVEVIATSTNGGVKSAGSAPKGFTNIINYRGTAIFGKATSVINTAKQKTAAGPEVGSVKATTQATRGSLVIRVRPAQPALPLVSGVDYNDTLRVTLTPD